MEGTNTVSYIICTTIMAQRQPLAPINPNYGYNKEFSVWQRSQISAYKAVGLPNEQIGGRVFCTPSTVKTTLRRNLLRNEGETRPRSGRPPALTRRDKRIILRIVRANPTTTYALLKQEANVTVHNNTLYQLLKEEGITNWLAKKRPLLTPEVVAKRYQWAKNHRNWNWDDWKKIIWSDQCSLERGRGPRRVWVFRTPEQKWNSDMIQPYKKGKDISVMIWGAIYGDGRSDVVIMDRDPDSEKSGYTANSHTAVLDDQIPRIWEPGMIFMQDNARIHNAKKIQKWFEDKAIPLMEWPLYPTRGQNCALLASKLLGSLGTQFFAAQLTQHHMVYLQAWFYVDLSIHQYPKQMGRKRRSFCSFRHQNHQNHCPNGPENRAQTCHCWSSSRNH
jgi:transposase